jgi:hypothetical protein
MEDLTVRTVDDRGSKQLHIGLIGLPFTNFGGEAGKEGQNPP